MEKKQKLEKIREHREEFRKEIEAIGESLREKQMPVLTEELFRIYEETGNRLIYENEYFERRRFLVVFGLLCIWYHKEMDRIKLEAVILEICEEETWALPAHVDRKQNGWQKTVDLFASETGQTLSEIITSLKGFLSEVCYQRVKREVIDRLIDSYLSVPMGEWRWESFHNNWTAVCAGSMGSIALYLLDDDKEKQDICIRRVLKTLPDYLSGMAEDGTCPEGLSYFTYGMSYFAGFARQLYDKTEGKVDLMGWPKVSDIARFQQKCYFTGKKTLSFSDGEREDKFRLGLTCYLARRIPGVMIPEIENAMYFMDDHCYRWISNYRDDIWTEEYLNAEEEENTFGMPAKEEWFTVLKSAQWAIGKSDNGVGFAIKGGNNDEPHNHNDVGGFLYLANGECFLVDLGCGEYTKDYFSEKRYTILCNRSLGHNVPLLNHSEQKNGAIYRADEFSCSDGKGEISYKDAYEEGLAKELKRKFQFDRIDGKLVLYDTLSPSSSTRSFRENLVTQIEPIIDENVLSLSGKYGRAQIEIAGHKTIEVKKEVFINHHGKKEPVWLIQWEVPEDTKYHCEITITYIAQP